MSTIRLAELLAAGLQLVPEANQVRQRCHSTSYSRLCITASSDNRQTERTKRTERKADFLSFSFFTSASATVLEIATKLLISYHLAFVFVFDGD
jgi:hypothetical protein